MDQDDILSGFIEESREHLQAIEPDLLELEKSGDNTDPKVINRIFRAVHSMKGASGFLGLTQIGDLSHTMENILSFLREGKISTSSEMIDALFAGVDTLKAMIDDVTASEDLDIQEELQQLKRIFEKDKAVFEKVSVAEKQTKTGIDENTKTFEIHIDQIEKFALHGEFLYSIEVSLKKDIEDKGVTLFEFVKTLDETGQLIDVNFDIDSMPDLSTYKESDLSSVFVYASILEVDLLAMALNLPEENITAIDYESHQKTIKIKKSDRKEKEQQKPEETVPQETDTSLREIDRSIPSEMDDKTETGKKQKGKIIPQVHTEEKIRVGVNILNDLVNLAGELVLGRNQLKQISSPLTKEIPGFNQLVQHISHITTEMQGKIMQIRMQPVSTLFDKFHRVVRDLSKKINKQIKLITTGGDVELDKSIIELLNDPFTHLIRNCIDHAIEMPDEREKKGKPRQGVIELKAYHQAGQVHLEITDDGAGIDGKRIGRKAYEKGLVTEEQVGAMSEKELVRLIFKPGFSTAEQITEVSGRGVGMDVVFTNIDHLGGIIDINTTLKKGTTMRLTLPLTLAILSGLVIRSAGQTFIIPEVNIEEMVRIKQDEIKNRINIVDNAKVLKLRERLLPLINLKDVLSLNGFSNDPSQEEIKGNEVPSDKETTDKCPVDLNNDEPIRVLVTRHGSVRICLVVDTIENIEEIVVKPLPRYLKKMKCYSGASIMGNGLIALILDMAGLIGKADFHFIESQDQKAEVKDEENIIEEDMQTLLLFDNNTDERFAFPLELITRIERIEASKIERIKVNKYLQYEGDKLRLVFLEDYLPINRPERNDGDAICLIIPKHISHPMGIVINRVIGSVNARVELDTETIMAPGLFGSAVLDEKITLLPDMYSLFELAAPEMFKKNDYKKDGEEKEKRILLVDDTPFFRMVESDYLTSAGYKVILAEDGKKALSILATQPVDAVILDIIMPEMDGWEVIQTIRAEDRWKDLPVMAVTSLGDKENAKKGLESGFTEWEGKLNKIRLLDKLEVMLQG